MRGIYRKSYLRKFHPDYFTDDELLGLPICNLAISIENSFLKNVIDTVKSELKSKNLLLTPSFWLSDEWFCADNYTGIAIPFYLANPRLIELEKMMMGYAEGDNPDYCLKLLRHEIGHAIDNAFRLRKLKTRPIVFGKSSIAYPSYYTYRPYSKNYVRNIVDGYAQSHPAEDFAETFAVWLDPKSNWESKYCSWPAIKKLKYMDSLMQKLAGVKPILRDNTLIDPISSMNKTLGQHYTAKQKKNGILNDGFWDRMLLRIFSDAPLYSANTPASIFLKKNRQEICRQISTQTGYTNYSLKQMLESMIDRTEKLSLKLTQKEMDTKNILGYYLTRKAKKYLSQGRHLIAL